MYIPNISKGLLRYMYLPNISTGLLRHMSIPNISKGLLRDIYIPIEQYRTVSGNFNPNTCRLVPKSPPQAMLWQDSLLFSLCLTASRPSLFWIISSSLPSSSFLYLHILPSRLHLFFLFLFLSLFLPPNLLIVALAPSLRSPSGELLFELGRQVEVTKEKGREEKKIK